MLNYLRERSELLPEWLARVDSVSQFNCRDFMGSRLVFYPGSGFDGHAVKLFGSTHSAHCFIYADYGKTQCDIENELVDVKYAFRGYSTLRRVTLNERDLTPQGWTSHIRPDEVDRSHFGQAAKDRPYGFIEILERTPEFDDAHGAARLAVLFLGADGIATYDALFCQQNSPLLYAALLEDYGFSGNYDNFGAGGLMEAIAGRTSRSPQLLVCRSGTEWAGYKQIPNLQPDRGGMHRYSRCLYAQLSVSRDRSDA